jgi:hypothetical protein
MAVAAARAPINITAAVAAVLLPLVVKALITPRPVVAAQAAQERRQLFLARPLLMQAVAVVALSTAQVERVVLVAVETAQLNLLQQTQQPELQTQAVAVAVVGIHNQIPQARLAVPVLSSSR